MCLLQPTDYEEDSEEFFRSVCNYLGAKVIFKDNGQYTLGDLLPEAMNRYKYILKEAKNSANSWNKPDEIYNLVNIEKNSKEIFNRTNAENWAVNANVHYNKWTDFTLEDFKPVVESFQDLYTVFKCDNCDGLLYLTMNGPHPEAMKCKCGSNNWNLRKK